MKDHLCLRYQQSHGKNVKREKRGLREEKFDKNNRKYSNNFANETDEKRKREKEREREIVCVCMRERERESLSGGWRLSYIRIRHRGKMKLIDIN